MSPPDLPRDAPITNVEHPLIVRIAPCGWNELDPPRPHSLYSRFSQGFHPNEPLSRHQWFHNGAAAVAQPDAVLVVLNFADQAESLQVFHNAGATFESVEPDVLPCRRIHLAIEADHLANLEPMPVGRCQNPAGRELE